MIRMAVGAALIWGACQPALAQDAALPPGLYLPARATEVSRRTLKNGVVYLDYALPDAYPPDAFIGELRAALEARGWSIPKENPLQPGTSNFLSGRWSEGSGPADKPRPYSRQWDGLWTDGRRSIARYVLQYTRVAESPETWSGLKVITVYWPSSVLQAVEQQPSKK